MQEKTIVDTSCLIILEKIQQLDLLRKLYGRVTITSVIEEEFNSTLPDWMDVVVVNVKKQTPLPISVDPGEASAILLALNSDKPLLILDDFKARGLAKSLDIPVTGTFGVLLRAKELGLIHLVKPELIKIQHTDFRMSEYLFELVLREAGEK